MCCVVVTCVDEAEGTMGQLEDNVNTTRTTMADRTRKCVSVKIVKHLEFKLTFCKFWLIRLIVHITERISVFAFK